MTLEYQSTTTLSRIRSARPCEDGWEKLLKHLGKTKADDAPLDLITVLDSNGLNDAIWVLSYAMPDDRLARHFQAWCAEQFLHIFEKECPKDNRVRAQIEALKNDSLNDAERLSARRAARRAALNGALRSAVRYAVWAAVGDSASCAALSATHSRNAWHAARDSQEKQLRKMLLQEDLS